MNGTLICLSCFNVRLGVGKDNLIPITEHDEKKVSQAS